MWSQGVILDGGWLRPVVVPRVLRLLPEQLRLQGEDVIEDAIDPPPFQPVVGDHARVLEVPAQRAAEWPVDTSLAAHLRVFEKLEAAVEGSLPGPVGTDVHSVPSTSIRPASVTRTCTLLSAGSVYPSLGRPSA